MWIMNLEWPITALYLGPVALWLHHRPLPEMTKRKSTQRQLPTRSHSRSESPDRIQTALAGFHCGAGCTLGDVMGEFGVVAFGLTFAQEFGWRLIIDFILAYLLGIAFQFFTIAPMRGFVFGEGLKAVRADTISITLFEIGMFDWMALTYFVLFPSPHLRPTQAVFWFMMQIAMIAGFITSYPANRWLIGKGWMEKMPQREEKYRASQDLRAA